MNFLQALKLKRKARAIVKKLKILEEERKKTLKTLEGLRDDLKEYLNLCYKFGVLSKEDLKELEGEIKKQVVDELKRIKEEEREKISYIG